MRYEVLLMRMFQKSNPTDIPAPIYCCQTDGMVSLGCGTHSYTKQLHYDSEYTVGVKVIQAILQADKVFYTIT